MTEQPVSREPKHATAYYFLLSLIGAALLMALGFIREGVLAPASGNQVQLSVVCVSGFSWDRGIHLHQGGKLPFIEQLFRGKGSCGDIISSRSDPDPAIVASLFTGCFPGKYSRYQEADLMHFIAPGPFQKPIWQELAARGQQCLVVGLAVASGPRTWSVRSRQCKRLRPTMPCTCFLIFRGWAAGSSGSRHVPTHSRRASEAHS
ncbi:MAG: hypothetical protein NTV89_12985 [Proteobacteria bacterium]|nr:hypothetical protein [Pseudomonadota bacterium]